ncbi:MAG: hypothetical protein GY867_01890 [bacterium]|nr:hypothetical protein [bacterium]
MLCQDRSKTAFDSLISIPTVVMMSFTFNLRIGITSGFVMYPIMKLLAGRIREVAAGTWGLALVSALSFVFYPY